MGLDPWYISSSFIDPSDYRVDILDMLHLHDVDGLEAKDTSLSSFDIWCVPRWYTTQEFDPFRQD